MFILSRTLTFVNSKHRLEFKHLIFTTNSKFVVEVEKGVADNRENNSHLSCFVDFLMH